MSSDESEQSLSDVGSILNEDTESEEDYGVVNLGANAPYRGEPLAVPGQAPAYRFDQDKDGIPLATIEARFERRVNVDSWCTCGKCSWDLLGGSLEYRCCMEIQEAIGKITFEGLDIPCITDHEDYKAVTNTAVIKQTGPLIKDRNGRAYRRRAGQTENQYLRAVCYRWVIRWIFGYLGWDNTRPLPACVYQHIRSKWPSNQTTGYASAQERFF